MSTITGVPAQNVAEIEPLLSRQQAAPLLGVHVKTLPRWEKQGLIRPLRLTGRVVRYRRSEIERILREAE